MTPCAVAGIMSDANIMVNTARVQVQCNTSYQSGNYGSWKAANNQAVQSILKQDHKYDITREELVQSKGARWAALVV
ncbi:N-terminal nucleophile aminohydrolases (Ntn hydrolases) superfamily protein [Tripterygium wilfordii]|uniref:N-terminal nucleophile aminohydrolases (Ntn hydrolases) superfamily protein n=1 Tax=Tripterygium wilfordii TaxID=458696 RepID=A0A7J7DST8_TRIWF|nr:N-terminal nucleophile aminohydrolases (Ntn hydrolases) superfamily protein [Tripterygium wilfordii]